jgi:hypothetical protein
MTRDHNATATVFAVCLCNNRAGSGALVLPGRRHDADGLVVSGETVDSGLDKDEAELGVLVLSIALEVLPYGNSLETHVSVVSMVANAAKLSILPS